MRRAASDPAEISLPKYAELPEAGGGARSGWFVFGEDDQVGLLNLQTPDRVVSAARLIVSGEVFALDLPVGTIDPPMFGRGMSRHTVIDEGTDCDFDDKLDNYYPQASSQWDSLAHVGFGPDQFYNGVTAAQVAGGRRNTIDKWAQRGIAGRGILIDVDALYRKAGHGFSPIDTIRVSVDDLERCREEAGVQWQPGDVMLLHTGFLGWYVRQDRPTRELCARADTDVLTGIGLDRGPEMLSYLWDSRIAAVAADNPGVEALPFDLTEQGWPFGFLHHCLIGQLGMALGELWWLADLAEACRTDGRYEFFLTSAPLQIAGGIGSPANALAIR